MFDKLSRRLRAAAPQSGPAPRHLAMAVLLVETARADFEDQPAERQAMQSALAAVLGLDARQSAQLIEQAFDQSRAAVSLHGFLRTLNTELDPAAKCELLEWLWRVAYADGRVAPHEEARIRQIAELLFIGHADFVRLRMKVEAEPAAPA
ncbi:TerB family tellurite resistance protein [Fontimonas sp. SYSU GA230001]|uniref:tellurite resistance TerB family protein n=1 Tax=Fontimonas sp. SYSU GA230001 TaxID=3142450 RepID=UPI0032B544DC